jgi:hypothetical protein
MREGLMMAIISFMYGPSKQSPVGIGDGASSAVPNSYFFGNLLMFIVDLSWCCLSVDCGE